MREMPELHRRSYVVVIRYSGRYGSLQSDSCAPTHATLVTSVAQIVKREEE